MECTEITAHISSNICFKIIASLREILMVLAAGVPSGNVKTVLKYHSLWGNGWF